MILSHTDTPNLAKAGVKLFAASATSYYHAGAYNHAIKVTLGEWYAF